MLEKMGWTSGKGLGANEQGMTEHVKVSYKNNQTGIGFQDKGDQWTRHQADFNDFLSQLQEQNSNSEGAKETEIKNEKTEEKEESLELKSKRSRARVHYHKFTRGKDVKKYSAKDLANIFGKKELKDQVHVSEVEETTEEITAEPKGSRDSRGGVLTIKGGNIDEYFRSKFSNYSNNGNTNEADDSEGEYQPRLGFGFSSVKSSSESPASGKNSERNKAPKNKGETDSTNSGFAFANEGLDLEYPDKSSDSNTEKVDFAYDNPCLSPERRQNSVEIAAVEFSAEGFVNPALNLNDSTNDNNNGAEFEVSRVEFGLDNDALDLSDENGRKKRVTFNETVEYNTDVEKKKKKKKKQRKGKDKLDKFEVDNSKLKKKSREISTPIELVSGIEAEGFVNEALDVEPINDEVNDNELNERKTKKSKRKKNRRTLSLETIEETAEEISQIDESEIGEAVLLDEASPRKNKRLKKNPELETNSETNPEVVEIEIEASEGKKKDKKEKKVHIIEETIPEKKSGKKKDKAKRSEEAEITVLAEISRKLSKSKKNKVANEPESSDLQEEAIESIERKKKDKKRSKSKTEGKDIEIISIEVNDEPDIPKSGSGTKRKSSGGENGVKLGKRSKLENGLAEGDEENVEQNRGVVVNVSPPTPRDKKDKRSRKTFKSLFMKAPTLYFSGSNINDMAGYGATVTEIKQ